MMTIHEFSFWTIVGYKVSAFTGYVALGASINLNCRFIELIFPSYRFGLDALNHQWSSHLSAVSMHGIILIIYRELLMIIARLVILFL
jgi:hypothetical protein